MSEYKVTVKGKHGSEVAVVVEGTSKDDVSVTALAVLADLGLLPEGPVEIVSVEVV